MYTKNFLIAGINIELQCERYFEIVDYFEIYQIDKEREEKANVVYRIKQVDGPLAFETPPVFESDRMTVYQIGTTEYRQFPWWNNSTAYPMTLKNDRKNPALYEFLLTDLQMEMFVNKLHFGSYLAVERVMLDYDCFQLHSSVISVNGQAILFSAPSGTGKSTQADLWKKYEQAEIINGDRGLIRKKEEGFIVYGSPYAGSSQIITTLCAPVRAVVVLTQASQNKITRLKQSDAFAKLYQETTVNSWNSQFILRIMDLLNVFVEQIPVYQLDCLPDQGAVELLKEELFFNENL